MERYANSFRTIASCAQLSSKEIKMSECPKRAWVDNQGLPDSFCGICGYNFKDNKNYFSTSCPKCKAYELNSAQQPLSAMLKRRIK